MESVGFLIFIIVGIIAIVAKVQEQKAQEARKRDRAKRQMRAEDLPERTRRMLYGSTTVKEARPRSAAPSVKQSSWEEATSIEPREVRVAKRRAEEVIAATPTPVEPPPRRRVVVATPPPPPARARSAEDEQERILRQKEFEASKKKRAPVAAKRYPRPQQKRPIAPRPPALDDVDAVARSAARQRTATTAQQDLAHNATRKRVRAKPSPQQKSIACLLKSGYDVRNGIIISEILGPSLALRS